MLLTPTKHSKAFASPSALEASTLEAILTCPQPADSWWSASDFRRYLVGLEAAGEVPELPSVVVIARALNKSELFGVSRTRTDEGRLLYRVRPPLARAMMLARSPAKRSPKTPERRKATPEGAPAVEADWTPPELATPATPAVEEVPWTPGDAATPAAPAVANVAPSPAPPAAAAPPPAAPPPSTPAPPAAGATPATACRLFGAGGRIETVLVPERGASPRAAVAEGAARRAVPRREPAAHAAAVAAVAATWLPSSSDECDSDGELRASLVVARDSQAALAAQFEDERDALRARLDAAERALAADDAARGAAAEARRVAAVAAAVAADAGGDRGDRGDTAAAPRARLAAAAAADRDRRVAQDAVVASLRGELAAARAAPPPDDGGGRRAADAYCEHLEREHAEVLRLLDGAEASSRAAAPAVAVERTPERAALAAEVARLAAALAAATDAAAAEREAREADFDGVAAELAALKAAEAERRAALDGPLSALKQKPAATPEPAAAALERELAAERARGATARRDFDAREAASVAALAAAALRLDGVLAAAAAPAAPDSGGAEQSLAAALAANRDVAARERALADRGAVQDAAVRDAAAAALARELDATREKLFDEGARRGALEEELEDVVGQLVEAKVATAELATRSAVKAKSRSPEAAAAAAAAAKAFLGQLDATAAADAAAARERAAAVEARAGKESEIPNFKGSYLGRFSLVSADFWTSDHLSERPRSMDAFSGMRARGTLMLKRT